MQIFYYKIYDFLKNETFFIRYKNGIVDFLDEIFSLDLFLKSLTVNSSLSIVTQIRVHFNFCRNQKKLTSFIFI